MIASAVVAEAGIGVWLSPLLVLACVWPWLDAGTAAGSVVLMLEAGETVRLERVVGASDTASGVVIGLVVEVVDARGAEVVGGGAGMVLKVCGGGAGGGGAAEIRGGAT